MALKPWYTVVMPREDLREGRPLDASEFAVHLDQVRMRRAPADYQQPERFFERTYLTANLIDLAAQVTRRLSGITVETSAVFNFATQFGGGKTHALTLLYHLAQGGQAANSWQGVNRILDRAQVGSVPHARIAIFVGTEFDTITGRGGDDGTPLRRTPWGEIAWQLGGQSAFDAVAQHDAQGAAPGGDVIRAMLPDGPTLILVDELVNFMGRNRKNGQTAQLYNFLQNLSETARGRDNLVLAVSIPSLESEMSAEDYADYDRFKKLLDRLGKPVLLSAETETAEIIRRRLFEWGGTPPEARRTSLEYAEWVKEHRQMVGDFDADHAYERFEACYPFHPALLSVFERKWQALPRFQKTRGMLRLLALWVSRAYQEGYKGAHKDPLIGIGTAPLDDTMFRTAMFEQLGNDGLEGPVTTDIMGKKDAHALRLDKDAPDAVKKARLHQKIATTILFESNGGHMRAEATVPEIRLAVGEPDLDVANVETVLEELTDRCYYLSEERNRYRFSLSPNLNKVLADRQASIQAGDIRNRVRQEVTAVFKMGPHIPERVYFPDKTDAAPDRAALTLVVCAPEQSFDDVGTRRLIESMVRERGNSSRTFKSALLFAVPDTLATVTEEARKLLAWEDIQADEETLKRLDAAYQRQLKFNVDKAARDLKEAVWRAYHHVLLLGKDNTLRHLDLGLVHSSAADTITALILNRLRGEGDIEDTISPNFLIRNWPPAFVEWSTRAMRDAFFASPQFPHLLSQEPLKETIAKGVSSGLLAYIGKKGNGEYEPFHFCKALTASDIEFVEDMYLITRATAEAYQQAQAQVQPQTAVPPLTRPTGQPYVTQPDTTPAVMPPATQNGSNGSSGVTFTEETSGYNIPALASGIAQLAWSGDVPTQKWMNFYTKVLSKFATGSGLKLTVRVEVAPTSGISSQKVEETKAALRELGLNDSLETS